MSSQKDTTIFVLCLRTVKNTQPVFVLFTHCQKYATVFVLLSTLSKIRNQYLYSYLRTVKNTQPVLVLFLRIVKHTQQYLSFFPHCENTQAMFVLCLVNCLEIFSGTPSIIHTRIKWVGPEMVGWGEGACVIPIPDNYSLRSELYDRSTEHIFKGSVREKWKGHLLNAIKQRFWSLLILLLSVASIRRKLIKTSHTE